MASGPRQPDMFDRVMGVVAALGGVATVLAPIIYLAVR